MQQLSAFECGVNIDSPKRDWNLNTQESSETRHTRVLTNLERFWFLDGATCSLDALLQWEKVNSAPISYKCILHPDDDNELLAGKMRSLVSTYQIVVCEWRQLPQITSVSSVEQRSREMLVMWIAFCLVHQRCLNEVPLCAEYNIALEWKDLKVGGSSGSSSHVCTSACRQVHSWLERGNQRPSALPHDESKTDI
ncbi:hypothetical protein JG688_00002685 [Phytophthora aleatoria]|uniref:Uncharacterized protein n=1 Tax=Phytophthora aleatoria TaxID=2496075 RepID=A0A8J5J5F1_9STRA|nr:hypothetical protein JG688_00002685 [Phytophthora aleatoria]